MSAIRGSLRRRVLSAPTDRDRAPWAPENARGRWCRVAISTTLELLGDRQRPPRGFRPIKRGELSHGGLAGRNTRLWESTSDRFRGRELGMRSCLPFLALSLGLAAIACGSKGALGDGCDTPSGADECESGLLCTNGETNTCLKECTDQDQCAATENCNGVSGGSLKSCQPK